MKLLVISAAYPPHRSGEATNAYHLCHNLAEKGVDVEVLTSRGCQNHSHPRIKLHPVMQRWSWMEMPRMMRTIRQCAPDAVLLIYIGWVYHYEFMVTYAASACRKHIPKTTFVTRFENAMGADPRSTSLFSRLLRKWMAWRNGGEGVDYFYGTLLRDSDRLVVLSERHRRILMEALPSAGPNSVLIPPPPNMCVTAASPASCRADLRRSHHLPEDSLVITYLGYLHAGKGIETLLRAFHEVSSSRPNVRLMLMGGTIDPASGNPTSYVQEMEKVASQLGIADKVLWTGEYSGTTDAASRLMLASDLCVLPFIKGVHLNNSSFASAAAHGLPIITTSGEDTEDQFVHGENVYICPPNAPTLLAAAICTVLDDADQRNRLRAGIARMTAEWFSWNRAVERTLAACQGDSVGV